MIKYSSIVIKDKSREKKTTCEDYGLLNLYINLYKVAKREIRAEDYKLKHNFFEKCATDIYTQQNIHCYNPDIGYEKERYSKLKKNWNTKNNFIAKLRLSSHNFAVVPIKWQHKEIIS